MNDLLIMTASILAAIGFMGTAVLAGRWFRAGTDEGRRLYVIPLRLCGAICTVFGVIALAIGGQTGTSVGITHLAASFVAWFLAGHTSAGLKQTRQGG